jgi:hypothetical protein
MLCFYDNLMTFALPPPGPIKIRGFCFTSANKCRPEREGAGGKTSHLNAAATERFHCPSSGFTSSLYEFMSNCQELSLVPLKEFTNSALRRALETIFKLFDDTSGVKKPLQLAA